MLVTVDDDEEDCTDDDEGVKSGFFMAFLRSSFGLDDGDEEGDGTERI